MTNKHTPGPWSIKRENGDINIVSDAVPYVAQVFTCPAVEVMNNARLIAAAPELLGALQSTLDHLVAVQGHNEGGIQIHIRSAIAKATGQ